MQESNSIQSWLPLRHVSDIQLILSNASVSSLQSWFHTLWRLICKFD